MKKGTRFCCAALCVAVAMMVGSACFAQTYPFLGAGSSAALNAMAVGGAIGTNPAICTNTPNNATLSLATNVWIWSQAGNTSSGHHDVLTASDGRGAFDLQHGPAWVEWDGLADGSTATHVCVYLSIDSIVGNRMFFATNAGGMPAGSISMSSCAASIPGDNQIPLFPADTDLPTVICNDLNGRTWNAAPSDIRAEDALFGTQRACATYAQAGTGFGYTCTGTPSEILSGIHGSTKKVQTVTYQITGNDPISGQPVAHSSAGSDGHPFVTLQGGGQAILVVVNTADTSANGLGNAAVDNVNRPDLARVFTGSATRTRDLIPTPGLASKALTVFNREPLSGTFNTFEFQVTRTAEFNHTSEDLANNGGGFFANGIGMAVPTGWTNQGLGVNGNPLDWKKTSTGGLKVRVIGTGEMVACVAATASCGDASQSDKSGNAFSNQIGYTFFSFGNVKPAIGLAKYLTVDGVDPLFDHYTGGALPSCTAPCSSAVALSHIVDGSYPIWNIFSVITTGALGAVDSNGACHTGATVCQLVQSLGASYALVPDLVAIGNMQAFRSHYTFASGTGVNFVGHNGYKHYGTGVTGTPCGFAPVTGAAVQYECGSSVGGARFVIQQELDTNTDTSTELTATYKQ